MRCPKVLPVHLPKTPTVICRDDVICRQGLKDDDGGDDDEER